MLQTLLKKTLAVTVFFLLLTGPSSYALELATEISEVNGRAVLSSIGYAKLGQWIASELDGESYLPFK